MDQWSFQRARETIHDFQALAPAQQSDFLNLLNRRFPPQEYEDQRRRLECARANAQALREMLARAVLEYPRVVDAGAIHARPESLRGCAIVFTAGGEGERLLLSLLKQGTPGERLRDFTKATYPIPGLAGDSGALQANLCAVRRLARTAGIEIPVVVTVGPAGTSTARVIPGVLERHGNFGLPHLRIVEQDERLHLTADRKIAYRIENGAAAPVTNPDETGGPLVKLRERDPRSGRSTLDWIEGLGCTRVIVLQAIAVYDPSLIVKMAASAQAFDGLGVGIPRRRFPPDDPYGTYAGTRTGSAAKVMIVEPDWRSDAMRELRDPTGVWYLPYNTGFYVFDTRVLRERSLPDYCTPPKEVLPGLPHAPKAGYAATDLLPLAANPAVLTVAPESFAVLKSVGDLPVMGEVARRFGLDAVIDL